MAYSRWQSWQSVCCHSTEDRKCLLRWWPHKHRESNEVESTFQNGHHYILSIEQLWSVWISMQFSLEVLQKFQFGSTFNLQRQITAKEWTPVRVQQSFPHRETYSHLATEQRTLGGHHKTNSPALPQRDGKGGMKTRDSIYFLSWRASTGSWLAKAIKRYKKWWYLRQLEISPLTRY